MTDAVTASIIGLGGAILVAVCGVITQISVTRRIIQAERAKVLLQIDNVDSRRRESKRKEQLLDLLSELISITDLDNRKKPDIGLISNLICRLQLLLDRSNPLEKELNGSINRLGHATRGDGDILGIEKNDLFRLHGEVIDLGAKVLRSPTDHTISKDS